MTKIRRVFLLSNEKDVARAEAELTTVCKTLQRLTDLDIGELLHRGGFDKLLIALLDKDQVRNYSSIAEFFLANKWRATTLAGMRLAITHNCSFGGPLKEGAAKHVFASPSHLQWDEDGVVLLEGPKPFEGLLQVYRDGQLHVVVIARDIPGGESIVFPDDVMLITIQEARDRQKQIPISSPDELQGASLELEKLLDSESNDESKYQEHLEKFPWCLGMSYKMFLRHAHLDDKNIPDFTGVRHTDGTRDIVEVKPPFARMFAADGELLAAFNDAWNQAERYLDFVRENKDYLLRQKGMHFENPTCLLILGYNLNASQVKALRRKQRVNPAITVYTYDELLRLAGGTIELVLGLRGEGS